MTEARGSAAALFEAVAWTVPLTGIRPMIRLASSHWLAWLPLLYLAVFFLVQTGIVASYSVMRRDFYGQVIRELSGEGWRQALDPITLKILGRSLGLACGVTAVCLVLGYP